MNFQEWLKLAQSRWGGSKERIGLILCIVGDQGCGKSTFVRSLGKTIAYMGKAITWLEEYNNFQIVEFDCAEVLKPETLAWIIADYDYYKKPFQKEFINQPRAWVPVITCASLELLPAFLRGRLLVVNFEDLTGLAEPKSAT